VTEVPSNHRVQITRVLSASPEQVFAAWTNPQALATWLCPFGKTLQVQSLDVRPGGSYSMRMQGTDGLDNLITGEYRVVEPPTCLEFTWTVEFFRPGADRSQEQKNTRIRIDLASEGSGTRLTLTHDRFTTESAAEDHRRGWSDCLEKLSAATNAIS